MTYISDSLVPIGTKRAAISIAELEKTLRMQYDQIAWITCDVEGTRLVVRFVETVEKEEVTTFDTPCNIVAVKDGIVLDLLAKSGTKLVNPGDEVKKGDVLITGVVNIYNEYEELIETNYVAADGIVYAQTKYQYQQAFPLDYTQKRQVSTTHTFHIGKAYYLPFSVTVTKYYQPIYETKTYTEEEARKKQEQLLQTYIADLKKKGVEILENNVTIECKDGECLASGILVVREIIGAPETFVIPEETIQKNEE